MIFLDCIRMNKFSRRQLLLTIAAVGGNTALYNTARALGIVEAPSKGKKAPIKPADSANKKVLLLGAGLSSLAAAYELERAGYDCTILESSHRIGGRNLTLRHGDMIDELGNTNYCKFDDEPNLFFNAGPARIPGHHSRILAYCKEFSVPLHVRSNTSRMAYVHDENAFGGYPIRIDRYLTDGRGFISELIQKGINTKAFDAELSAEDLEKLADFATVFGDLRPDGLYSGSERSGSQNDFHMDKANPFPPYSFKELLKTKNGWENINIATELFDWAEPLMEPIGGMDKIIDGFVERLQSPIVLNSMVQKINLSDAGVTVYYQKDNKIQTATVDYCFNSIPAHFMAGIDNNFSPDLNQALAALKRGHLSKIAFQMKKRFWEDEGIYGGISYTTQDVAQLWYPSHDIHSEKGIMLGAYSWNEEQNAKLEAMNLNQRLKYAAEAGEKIHKNYSSYIESGASVMWSRMNHMMGCGAHMPNDDKDQHMEKLQKPERRHFMIGDQVSLHSGWQESALAATESALTHFNKMRLEEV